MGTSIRHLLFALLVMSLSAQASERHPKDTRKAQSHSSPSFLNATSRVIYHFNLPEGKAVKPCSGTLIATKPNQDSRIVVSAWHCVRVGDIHWQGTSMQGDTVTRSAKVLEAFSDPGHDLVVLLLDKKVSHKKIQPALIDFDSGVQFNRYKRKFRAVHYAAGYSVDPIVGQNGNVLTYDEKIWLGPAAGPLGGLAHTVTYDGSSGGSIYSVMDTKNGLGKQVYLTGITLAGVGDLNSNDGQLKGTTLTMFLEKDRFMEMAKQALHAYP